MFGLVIFTLKFYLFIVVVVAPVREVEVISSSERYRSVMERMKLILRILLLCLCSTTAYGICLSTCTIKSRWHFCSRISSSEQMNDLGTCVCVCLLHLCVIAKHNQTNGYLFGGYWHIKYEVINEMSVRIICYATHRPRQQLTSDLHQPFKQKFTTINNDGACFPPRWCELLVGRSERVRNRYTTL